MIEITFKDFQQVMVKRKRTVDDLVDIFRGKLDDTRDFFERVMSCKWHNEDRSNVVIPYRSVIEFYVKEKNYLTDSEQEAQKQAEKRKLGPMNEERRAIQLKNLEKANAARSRKFQK